MERFKEVHEKCSSQNNSKFWNFMVLGVGYGSIAYNAKKDIAALLPIRNQVGYHVFDFNNMEVVRKAQWQAKHTRD